jgi:acetyl-CoA acetyltransferase
MRDPITLDDHAASPWIAEPFRKLDCCLETDGACAVVLGPVEQAKNAPHPAFTLTAWAAAFGSNGFSNSDGDLTTAPSALVARELHARAGIGPADIDIAQLYDAFTFTVLLVSAQHPRPRLGTAFGPTRLASLCVGVVEEGERVDLEVARRDEEATEVAQRRTGAVAGVG